MRKQRRLTGRLRPYNTEGPRRQLGATSMRSSHSERGIMTMQSPGQHSSPPSRSPGVNLFDILPRFSIIRPSGELNTAVVTNQTTSPCAVMQFGADSADSQPSGTGNPAHISLFSDSLDATGSPARAMQAWYTTAAIPGLASPAY
ncbi:hypothetical protein B0T16DRAFT_421332 [Cercophora newfieldiana]|uniref:Uncharacterized protein n=1 Tax=Cercophora newfieldiana TaxID=92897 RepID=A0AA39XRP3_9PEZI|nr:hypothetical protein B0T16DRAFT_421332 [Cercophora newfieldiana]